MSVRIRISAAAVLCGVCAESFAQDVDPASWLDGVMLELRNTKFEFSRSQSAVPYMPVVSLSHRAYGRSEFERMKGGGEPIEFRSQFSSAYAVAPLYIGEYSVAAAVPHVGRTHFSFTGIDRKDADVSVLHLPVGAAWQVDEAHQWGCFLMPAGYSSLDREDEWIASGMAGVFGRTLHGDRVAWFYGAIYDYAFSDGYYLPYLGFSYLLDPSWVISMVAPWPTVSYAPSEDFMLQVGAMPSGAYWAMKPDESGDQVVSSFAGWDLGCWASFRLSKPWWLAVGGGWSGLRSFEISAQGETDFRQQLDPEPWIGVSLSMRPD